MSRPLRVFQVASGNVGTEMIKRIQNHPDLELVGLHCYSRDKDGRDVGEIAGIGPIGIAATGTVDEILAARPDCLTFHCVWPDIDLPKAGTDFSTPESFAKIGMTVTGMPALNSIRAIVDAAPGIVTSADLPLRAFAGRFAR
jgi:hypothetical protein